MVNWPLQRDTGRMGAACGRVLFALEQLLERSNETNMVTNPELEHTKLGGLLSRPFCLWDAGHINPTDPSRWVDNFGRCASYGKEEDLDDLLGASEESSDRYISKEKNYFASKEQYYEDELTVVLGVWDDFCKEHWPEFYETKDNEEDRIESQALYSDLSSPPQAEIIPSRLQTTKNKKSLITMR